MTSAEFIQATSDIEKFYNKELNKFESQQWYQELKNMPIERYRQVIRQVYRKCKFMPKLADIVGINDEMVYSKNNNQEVQREACSICEGRGIIFYNKVIEGMNYQYVARCNCKNGLNYVYDGTQVSDPKGRSKYYIPTLEMINLKGE